MPGFWKIVFNNYKVKEGIRKKGTSEATGTPVGRDVPCSHWALDRVRGGGGDRGLGGSVAGGKNDVFKIWSCHHLVVKWGCYLIVLFLFLSTPPHQESCWVNLGFSSSQNLWVESFLESPCLLLYLPLPAASLAESSQTQTAAGWPTWQHTLESQQNRLPHLPCALYSRWVKNPTVSFLIRISMLIPNYLLWLV